MARLEPLERDALPADARRFHDAVKAIRRRPISGPFITLLHGSPDLAARYAHLGHYFHSRGQADESILSPRVRTLAALLGARALDVPYEWGAWVGWALEAGVPQESVDAIRESRALPHPSPEDALVCAFCAGLMSEAHRVDAATYAAALEHFGSQGVVELAMTLGYFAMIALPLNAFEIEMSAAQLALRKPFTPLEVRAASDTQRSARSAPGPFTAHAGAPRLPPLLTHEDVAPGHQQFLDRIVRTRGWISGAYALLLHTPDVAERVANVGAFVLYDSALRPETRALVALVAARELDCGYLWHAGLHAAGDRATASALAAAIEHGGAPEGAGEPALASFCLQLLRGNHHVDEPTYRAVLERHGVAATVQIAASLGYFFMMGLVVNAFEVPPETDSARPAL